MPPACLAELQGMSCMHMLKHTNPTRQHADIDPEALVPKLAQDQAGVHSVVFALGRCWRLRRHLEGVVPEHANAHE